MSICLACLPSLSLPPLCISYPGCPLPDDAHTLATSGSLPPLLPSLSLSTCAKVSEASFHSLILKAQSIFGKQPSMHMTNSDRARNDMLYSLYRSITSVSTHTSHSHSHTHTHSHSLPALVCASECAFDDLQKVLALPSFALPRGIPCKRPARKGAYPYILLAYRTSSSLPTFHIYCCRSCFPFAR